MKDQTAITCPNCHSHEVKKSINLPIMMFAVAFATVWIERVGWILSLIFLAIGLVMFLKSKGGKRMKCLKCGENFFVSKESFKKYQIQKDESHHHA
ncbi:MAG: hypothetical protein ACI35R_16085 [Bacillus sp. (in: firmicutes)]